MSKKISLKAFWETVERQIDAYSAEELRTLLRAMAHDIPPSGRQAFLGKLRLPEEVAPSAQAAIRQDDLLADIADAIQELESEITSADDRDYDWDEYDDEDSLGSYAEFIPNLVELYDRVQAVFEQASFDLARDAYLRLFKAFDFEDDYGLGIRPDDLESHDLDIEEIFARYLRAVYETAPPDQRASTLFKQLNHVRSLHSCHPTLADVLNISPQSLPDQDRFMADWIDYLKIRSGSDADAWLREAVRLSQGTEGLAELARTEGQRRPRAYLDWLAALAEGSDYQAVLATAKQALDVLNSDLPIRAAVADYLSDAASKLNDNDALHQGCWEAFLAKPELRRLLQLWEATGPVTRTEQMQRAVQHLRAYQRRSAKAGVDLETDFDWIPGSDNLEHRVSVSEHLLVHALLLADDWNGAQELAAKHDVLGWSYSGRSQALVVAFSLMRLAGETPGSLPPNLKKLWCSSAGNGYEWMSYPVPPSAGPTLAEQLDRSYGERLADTAFTDNQRTTAREWCLEVARKRVQAIVGGQHRKSYDKAAMLTVACSEMLRLCNCRAEAGAFVADIRGQFPRHSAFQREIKAAL